MNREPALVEERIAAPEQQILLQRARRLAQEPRSSAGQGADEAGEAVDVLVCRVADERYAVELRHLHGVHRASDLVPVPCVPAHVAGILNVRGEVVTVIDLAAASGLPRATPVEGGWVVLVDVPLGGPQPLPAQRTLAHAPAQPAVRVGVLVDEVLEASRLAASDLGPSLSGNEHTRVLAGGSLVLLDLAGLLGSGRFEVMEDVT